MDIRMYVYVNAAARRAAGAVVHAVEQVSFTCTHIGRQPQTL